MLVTSLNLNGLRSASKKGFFEWLERTQPDMLCLQEVRSMPDDIPASKWGDWTVHWFPAEKPGYSGVAIVTKLPGAVRRGCGLGWADQEGRVIGFSLEGYDLDVYSCYFPSGTSGEERQRFKMEFLGHMKGFLGERLRSGRPTVVCGDINVVHTAMDIKNAKGNENKTGFLPEERQWLTDLYASGWRDSFRELNPTKVAYSWWTIWGSAYERDVGWRIDHQWATPGLRLEEASIERDAKLSDHAPIHLRLSPERRA